MMKKQAVILTSLWLLPFGMYGQGISWVRHMGGGGTDHPVNSCTDSFGNLYVTGTFGFGATTAFFGNETLTTPALFSAFVTKLDPNGEFQWAHRIGGTFATPEGGNSNGSRVSYDSHTDKLFLSSALSGNNQVIGTCDTDDSGRYLSCMNTDGNCLWTTNQQNISFIRSETDGFGSLFALLRTQPGGGVLNGESITSGWHIAKLNALDGSTVWSKHVADVNILVTSAKFKEGHLYILGYVVEETWMWDTVQVNNHPSDIFLVKYDDMGDLQWVRTYGGSGIDGAMGYDIDDNGNIFMSGGFSDTAYFGMDSYLINDGSDRNFFAAKLDPEGEPEWLFQIPTQGNLYSKDLRIDANGDLLCVAHFDGSMDLAEGLMNARSQDAIVVKLDSSGNYLNAFSFEVGNANYTYVHPVSDDLVFLMSGYVGETTIGSTFVPSFGGQDVLVARLDYTTGVPEARLSDNELHIYANPSAGKCNITVPDEFLYESQLTLRIMDMDGRLVSEQVLNMSSSKIGLNLEAEASGVYNISLSNGVKQYFGKAVFE